MPISKAQTLLLSDITESIRYIKLETNPKCLLGDNPDLKASKNFIIIKSNGVVMQFSNDGNFIRSINSLGKGPNEFKCNSFCVDSESNEVLMLGHYKKNIYIADSLGNLFTIPIPEPIKDYHINYINKIPKTDLIVLTPDISSGNVQYCLFAISDDGKLIQKFSNPENYIHNSRIYESIIWPSPFSVTAGELLYKNNFNDTIFQIQPNIKFKPKYIFDLDKYKFTLEEYVKVSARDIDKSIRDKKILIWSTSETKRFLFFTHYSQKEMYLGLFDKSNNILTENYKPSLENNIDGGINLYPIPMYQYNNCFYQLINSFKLKAHVASEAFKNATPLYPEKKKELEQLANSLDENDNPVLMLIKLKE